MQFKKSKNQSKSFSFFAFAVFILTAFAGNTVVGGKKQLSDNEEPVKETQSFENDKVPVFLSVAKGKVSISDIRSQDGSNSLRWDWIPGDVLTFKTGPLGNIKLRIGYGGYSRSAFTIRIYNQKQTEGSLLFKWMDGDKCAASFEFPLVFKGWQKICYHYSHKSKLKRYPGTSVAKAETIIVEAPKSGKGGSVYFDMIDFNKPVDFRGSRTPISTVWKPLCIEKDCNTPAIKAAPTPAELAAIDVLSNSLAKQGNAKLSEKTVKAIEVMLKKKYGLVRMEDGSVRGTSGGNSRQISGDLLKIAKLWLSTSQPEMKTRLEECYFLLDDYFRELGAVPQGSMPDLNWYHGRNHGNACFIMRKPLQRTGRLNPVRNCLKYFWGYNLEFSIPEYRKRMSMDHFYLTTPFLLKIALMHDAPAEIVSHLRLFSRRFSIDIKNQIEPDGSLFHHGAYNFPYVSYELPVMIQQVKLLSQTPFAVPLETFLKLKLATMDLRWFCNLTDATLSMHGRHPGRISMNSKQYLNLAEAGRKYNNGKLDRELAAAYLRLVPEDAGKPLFSSEGIKPEKPEGNYAMNFAALMGHRRDEWLAVVRGYSKYSWAQESYAAANRHGLFMGNGYLDIIASGNPINIVDSGCDVNHGWNWCNLDGITSYTAPLKQIANGNGTHHERSDITFVGGVSDGKNGAFVFPLHSHVQYRKSLPKGTKGKKDGVFNANKTYFFFDGRIVCLGSGISLPDSSYPVHTTLFQKHLKTPKTPIQIDSKKITKLPFDSILTKDVFHTLMDIQETGYFIPPGQDLKVKRENQKSRDGHDKKDTTGDYATAMLEHGVNPVDAEYEYYVMPKTTPEKLAKFANKMSGIGGEKPVLIWQKDANAHIVLDRTSNTWGAVFFRSMTFKDPKKPWYSFLPFISSPETVFPVKSVSSPCLVLIKQDKAGTLQVSVGDPDWHPGENGTFLANDVEITFRGKWQLVKDELGIKIASDADDNSVVSISCREGKSFIFKLIKK